MDPEKTLTFCLGLKAEEVSALHTHARTHNARTAGQQLGFSSPAEQHASPSACVVVVVVDKQWSHPFVTS